MRPHIALICWYWNINQFAIVYPFRTRLRNAGVLWGEAFKRKNYFLDKDIAQQYRDELDKDKDKDSYEDALNNIGSKIDFVNLVKTLSDDKEIKIIDYNKDLVSFVNDKLDIVQPKFITDLEKIAEKTNDKVLLNQVK